MSYSFSRVDCFEQCPQKYKYRYVDGLKTLFNCDPQNPLIIGTALHHGIEKTVEEAITEYCMSYPIITTAHTYEAIKLEHWIPKVKQLINTGNELTFEFEINAGIFHGYIDLLEKQPDGTYCIYDFKYSNNIDHYMESAQLHLYKHYFEKQTGLKVSHIGFIFVPKCQIRQKKTETEYQFIKRLHEELNKKSVIVKELEYDEKLVEAFKQSTINIMSADEYPKNETKLCDYCEFKKYCQDGDEEEIMLPSINRVDVSKASKKKVWIYGAAFSGKTTFADQAPTPLNLNTDGNVKYVSMPRLQIKDEVSMNGRIKETKFAWQVFKDAIEELETGSDFETIVVDLLEDTYEYCRLYMYDKLGIEHESDDTFRAWDKVRSEYMRWIKKLLNLDYNIILISHEDKTKDITKKSGDKYTSISPNINEKVSKKVAGLVDIVARVVVEDDGERYLDFKSNEVVFGGGRLKGITETRIDLSWDALMKVYDQANSGGEVIAEAESKPRRTRVAREEATKDDAPVVEETPVEAPVVEEKPTRKTRKVRG